LENCEPGYVVCIEVQLLCDCFRITQTHDVWQNTLNERRREQVENADNSRSRREQIVDLFHDPLGKRNGVVDRDGLRAAWGAYLRVGKASAPRGPAPQ
jgi:hypothetical protein